MPRPTRPYPPRRNAWTFPPPALSPRWLPVAWVAGVLGVLAVAGGVVGIIVVGSSDSPGFIDDSRTLRTIDQQCAYLEDTVRDEPVRGTPTEQSEAIRTQNAAIDDLVEHVRGLGKTRIARDRPTAQWLRDWERLKQARAAVADALDRGDETTFRVPRSPDGERIDRRMNTAAQLSNCTVPRGLLRTSPVVD